MIALAATYAAAARLGWLVGLYGPLRLDPGKSPPGRTVARRAAPVSVRAALAAGRAGMIPGDAVCRPSSTRPAPGARFAAPCSHGTATAAPSPSLTTSASSAAVLRRPACTFTTSPWHRLTRSTRPTSPLSARLITRRGTASSGTARVS